MQGVLGSIRLPMIGRVGAEIVWNIADFNANVRQNDEKAGQNG